jgi:hypothetical protein
LHECDCREQRGAPISRALINEATFGRKGASAKTARPLLHALAFIYRDGLKDRIARLPSFRSPSSISRIQCSSWTATFSCISATAGLIAHKSTHTSVRNALSILVEERCWVRQGTSTHLTASFPDTFHHQCSSSSETPVGGPLGGSGGRRGELLRDCFT